METPEQKNSPAKNPEQPHMAEAAGGPAAADTPAAHRPTDEYSMRKAAWLDAVEEASSAKGKRNSMEKAAFFVLFVAFSALFAATQFYSTILIWLAGGLAAVALILLASAFSVDVPNRERDRDEAKYEFDELVANLTTSANRHSTPVP